MREDWKQDHSSRYERYTRGPWVVYKDETPHHYTAYDKRKLGQTHMSFGNMEHAMIYAETMEAVGA